jgi:AcrR family transcriptional regulator
MIQKVRSLYMKYGIKSVSMDDVAKELSISKKTLYQHISDKNELVEKVIDSEITERLANFENILKKDLNAIDELLEVNKLVTKDNESNNLSLEFDLKKYYFPLWEKVKQTRRDKMLEWIRRNMEKGKAEGYYREDLNIDIISRLHVQRIGNFAENDMFSSSELCSSKLFKEVFTYHLYGICSEKGIRYMEEKLKGLKSKIREKEKKV